MTASELGEQQQAKEAADHDRPGIQEGQEVRPGAHRACVVKFDQTGSDDPYAEHGRHSKPPCYPSHLKPSHGLTSLTTLAGSSRQIVMEGTQGRMDRHGVAMIRDATQLTENEL